MNDCTMDDQDYGIFHETASEKSLRRMEAQLRRVGALAIEVLAFEPCAPIDIEVNHRPAGQ